MFIGNKFGCGSGETQLRFCAEKGIYECDLQTIGPVMIRRWYTYMDSQGLKVNNGILDQVWNHSYK